MIARRPNPILRTAFTLVELLVVITIIIIASALTLPAFSRVIQSSNYAQGVNLVTATLSNARALAIRNGRHTGVAFFFDAATQRCTLQVLELQGQQSAYLSPFSGGNDACDPTQSGYNVNSAQAFAPAFNSPPVELPPGLIVCGLSFSVSCADALIDVDTAHWYAGERASDPDSGDDMWLWLFPHNDPKLYTDIDSTTRVGLDPWPVLVGNSNAMSRDVARAAVRHSQTFFVQFTPEGTVSTTTNTGGSNFINAYIEFGDAPLDEDDALAGPWDEPAVFDPDLDPPDLGGDNQRNPECVMRAVATLAVVDIEDLATAPAIAEPRPWLYRAEDVQNSVAPQPAWMTSYYDDEKVIAVSRWIDRNAQILAFNRYTGQVMRRLDR